MNVNGKFYPMWGSIIEQKDRWIGGTLSESDCGEIETTEISDITLSPNGEESAWFEVVGEDFSCGFDIQHGGVTGSDHIDPNSITLSFSGGFGLNFMIEVPVIASCDHPTLLPCPFCGSAPELPSGMGTQYEIWCDDCGQSVVSVQISDLMTIEERVDDPFADDRYKQQYIDRAMIEAIEKWNTRWNGDEAP